MELQQMAELLDNRIKAQTSDILNAVDKMIDSKLESIRNDIGVIKTDLSNLRLHTDSINTRLSKLEERMARTESKIDSIILNNSKSTYAAA